MSVQKINLFEQVGQFYLGTQAGIEGSSGVLEGSIGYATDINKFGSYNGATWDWVGTSGGGHVIQDEGTPMTARANLNFIGAGVTATDNAGTGATDITIPGGSGWTPTATSDLDMDSYDIDNLDTANFILSPGGTLGEGSLQWASDDETLQIGLHGGVALQIGQETMILAKNQTGASLVDGKVVVYAGAVGVSGRMKIQYGIADGTQQGKLFLGVVTETIGDGDDGFVTTFGKVRGIQTDGANYGETWADGDILWASPTTAGALTNVEPTAPNLRIPMAVVIVAHATTGTIFVRAYQGTYLHELHDAKIVAVANKEMLTYNSSTGMWENGPISDLTTLGHFQDINRFGFIASYDGSTGTTISFDSGTYTFTLTDTGSGWGYYLDGIACRFTGNRTIVLTGTPPVSGDHYIYFDDNTGVLKQSTSVWSLEGNKVPVVMILWDNALTPKYWLGDERHTSSIDRRLHLYLHINLGSRWTSGGIPSGYSIAPASPSDANNTFGLSEAILFDEDIKHTLTALVDPDGTSNSYVIMFQSGGSWVWEYSTMPYRFTAAGYIQYDNAGAMTQGQAIKYYNTYLLITHFKEASAGVGSFQIIHGKQEFSSLSAAQAEDPYAFDFTGFPLVECVIGWQFTWQTSNAYSSKGKCRLAVAPKKLGTPITSSLAAAPAVSAGGVATDTTNFDVLLSATDTNVQKALDTLDGHTHDHGGLTGLGDDDHTQYHTDARGDARYAPLAKGVTNGDSHDHNGGDGAVIPEGGMSLSDVTTLDVSTSKHGFAPKLPNDASKFLDGVGAWSYLPVDRWTPIPSTFTRTGNFTFTISGNYGTTFKKGTRVKLTDTTDKFGVVYESVYSAPNTYITLFTNTDYTLAANPSAMWVSRDALPGDFPAYFNYTPATSNVTIGNGSISGTFFVLGIEVFGDWTLTRGSTTSFTGNVSVGFPCTVDQNTYFVVGNVSLVDTATALYTGIQLADGTVRCMNAAGTYAVYAYVTGTAPFTWGNADVIEGSFRYKF